MSITYFMKAHLWHSQRYHSCADWVCSFLLLYNRNVDLIARICTVHKFCAANDYHEKVFSEEFE